MRLRRSSGKGLLIGRATEVQAFSPVKEGLVNAAARP